MKKHKAYFKLFLTPALLVMFYIVPLSHAQLSSQNNGVYVGQMKEVTKSRQPPCSPAQDVRVTVENGVVIMPPFLLGGGQNTKISALIESDGTFIGKLPGAEMRGKIVGTALDAKIIVPRRCVYDITATKN